MRKFLLSFKYAFFGVIYAIRNERNMRIHIASALAVFILAVVYKFNAQRWAILALTVSAVMALELVNTAIERVCNLYSTKQHPLIKAAKDTAAGAVLIAAMGALCVGICLFAQPQQLQSLWQTVCANPLYIVLILIYIAAAVCFVVFGGVSKNKK